MNTNLGDTMEKPIPLTKFMVQFVLVNCFGEWLKVAQLATIQVLGLAKDEHTFSIELCK